MMLEIYFSFFKMCHTWNYVFITKCYRCKVLQNEREREFAIFVIGLSRVDCCGEETVVFLKEGRRVVVCRWSSFFKLFPFLLWLLGEMDFQWISLSSLAFSLFCTTLDTFLNSKLFITFLSFLSLWVCIPSLILICFLLNMAKKLYKKLKQID